MVLVLWRTYSGGAGGTLFFCCVLPLLAARAAALCAVSLTHPCFWVRWREPCLLLAHAVEAGVQAFALGTHLPLLLQAGQQPERRSSIWVAYLAIQGGHYVAFAFALLRYRVRFVVGFPLQVCRGVGGGVRVLGAASRPGTPGSRLTLCAKKLRRGLGFKVRV
jgi:hypothetical protein